MGTASAATAAPPADAAPAPAAGPTPAADYRVAHGAERETLMRQLRDAAVPVLLHAADGSALSSTLRSIDAAQRRLGFFADAAWPQLDRLVECDEAVATAFVDNIRLQFELRGFTVVHDGERCALQADWPDEVFRFQRRAAFRVATAERSLPVVELAHPLLPGVSLSLRVLDLSLGGCALWWPQLPPEVPPLPAGSEWAEARVELDTVTQLPVALTLQYVTAFAPQGRGMRLGCEWTLTRPGDERVLQRWIDQAQRRDRQRQRSARAPG
jgi:c-di-GMP-binding flagellar brake protein YcgR